MEARRRSPAAEIRFTLACAAAMLVLVCLVGLASSWVVTCPETGTGGWTDCGSQADAEWRSDGLPNWVTPDLLLAALGVSLGILAGTVVHRHRASRASRAAS